MATFYRSFILLLLIGFSSVLSEEVIPDSFSQCPTAKRLRRGAPRKVLLVSPEKPELAQEGGYPYALNYGYSKLSRTDPDIHVVIGGGGGGGGGGGIYIHGDLGAVLPGNSPSGGGSFGGGGGGGFTPKYYTVHRAHGIYSERPEPTDLIYGRPTFKTVDYKNIDPSDVSRIKSYQREFALSQENHPRVVTDTTNKRVYYPVSPNHENIGTGHPEYLDKSDFHSHPEEIVKNEYVKKIILERVPSSSNDGYGEAHHPIVQIQRAHSQHLNPPFHLYDPDHHEEHPKEFHILTNDPRTTHFQTNLNQGSNHPDVFPIEKAPKTHLVITPGHLIPSTNEDLFVNRQYSNVHDHNFDQGVHKEESYGNHYIYQKEYSDDPSHVNYQVHADEREKYPVIKLNGEGSLKERQSPSNFGVHENSGYINIGSEEQSPSPVLKSSHLLQDILSPSRDHLNYGVKLVREPKIKSTPVNNDRNKNYDLISRELNENTDVYGSGLKNANDSKNKQDSTQSGPKQTLYPKNIHTSVN